LLEYNQLLKHQMQSNWSVIDYLKGSLNGSHLLRRTRKYSLNAVENMTNYFSSDHLLLVLFLYKLRSISRFRMSYFFSLMKFANFDFFSTVFKVIVHFVEICFFEFVILNVFNFIIIFSKTLISYK
jgi:hypothetical protein